jgi:hypothetical protein
LTMRISFVIGIVDGWFNRCRCDTSLLLIIMTAKWMNTYWVVDNPSLFLFHSHMAAYVRWFFLIRTTFVVCRRLWFLVWFHHHWLIEFQLGYYRHHHWFDVLFDVYYLKLNVNHVKILYLLLFYQYFHFEIQLFEMNLMMLLLNQYQQ